MHLQRNGIALYDNKHNDLKVGLGGRPCRGQHWDIIFILSVPLTRQASDLSSFLSARKLCEIRKWPQACQKPASLS